MSRKKSFLTLMAQAQKEVERNRQAQLRAQTQAWKEADNAKKAYEKAVKQQEKASLAEAKVQRENYIQSRVAQIEWKNAQLQETIAQLNNLLTDTLAVDDFIDLDSLKQQANIPQFNPGNLTIPTPAPNWVNYAPPEPSGVQKLMPGVKQKHAQELAAAQQRFNNDISLHAHYEVQRVTALDAAYSNYLRQSEEAKQQVAKQNAEIDHFKKELMDGLPDAIINYFSLVLESSSYPEGFPQKAKIAYVPESKQLVLEYYLPSYDIVPTINGYKYVKTKDEESEIPRPIAQRKELYSKVVAQVTIRTIHELFEADRCNHLETIVFNGMVDSIDLSTGNDITICLVTLRTTRDTFEKLNLKNVDPQECLKGLNASVSKSPSELAPVRPVLEFNMVDRRFVQETDILGGLDQRANLMDLTPSEFESLITNLFQKMGLEAKLTQASRDGGVDCVAYDPRPIFGGKVIIQAKRYKSTVGVSAVRDLYGTVHNEGASKGILVTTSGYGKDAFNFAENKPLELLDGSNLLFLLSQYAGMDAKIVMPED